MLKIVRRQVRVEGALSVALHRESRLAVCPPCVKQIVG